MFTLWYCRMKSPCHDALASGTFLIACSMQGVSCGPQPVWQTVMADFGWSARLKVARAHGAHAHTICCSNSWCCLQRPCRPGNRRTGIQVVGQAERRRCWHPAGSRPCGPLSPQYDAHSCLPSMAAGGWPNLDLAYGHSPDLSMAVCSPSSLRTREGSLPRTPSVLLYNGIV